MKSMGQYDFCETEGDKSFPNMLMSGKLEKANDVRLIMQKLDGSKVETATKPHYVEAQNCV